MLQKRVGVWFHIVSLCLTLDLKISYNRIIVCYIGKLLTLHTVRLQGHNIVNTSSASLLSNRVLTINVGFLLSDGPGNQKNIEVEIDNPVRIADDLVAKSIQGHLKLSRTREGILVQGNLDISVDRECARCLDAFVHDIPVNVAELYASPHPIGETEFFVGQDAKLNLAPLLRAEILIALSHRELCREDCKGLCTVCGVNHNHENCDCEIDNIDPRLAKLKELLDSDSI